MGSKVWVSFSWIIFQPLHEEIVKFYCTASSFHNMFHLVHSKVLNEANTVPCKVIRCSKLWGCTFSWTCFEMHRLSCIRKPNFISPDTFAFWKIQLNQLHTIIKFLYLILTLSNFMFYSIDCLYRYTNADLKTPPHMF